VIKYGCKIKQRNLIDKFNCIVTYVTFHLSFILIIRSVYKKLIISGVILRGGYPGNRGR
jgi:hypothetical protein